MLKMFSTQLTGLLKRIQDKEEHSLEDGARLLAQALVGEGHIYLYAEGEFQGVIAEATESLEPLERIRSLRVEDIQQVTDADRVLIFSRYDHDPRALELARQLADLRIPFVTVATVAGTEEAETLADLSYVHIDLHLKKALLPDEEGNRFGYPASIAALYVYYGLKFAIEEILTEYN